VKSGNTGTDVGADLGVHLPIDFRKFLKNTFWSQKLLKMVFFSKILHKFVPERI
jgi:hypothetical protein